MALFVDRAGGVWGIRRGASFDAVAPTDRAWLLCQARHGCADPFRHVIAQIEKADALALLVAWGFPSDEIWRADDFRLTESVTQARKSLKFRSVPMASRLIGQAWALPPVTLGG